MSLLFSRLKTKLHIQFLKKKWSHKLKLLYLDCSSACKEFSTWWADENLCTLTHDHFIAVCPPDWTLWFWQVFSISVCNLHELFGEWCVSHPSEIVSMRIWLRIMAEPTTKPVKWYDVRNSAIKPVVIVYSLMVFIANCKTCDWMHNVGSYCKMIIIARLWLSLWTLCPSFCFL